MHVRALCSGLEDDIRVGPNRRLVVPAPSREDAAPRRLAVLPSPKRELRWGPWAKLTEYRSQYEGFVDTLITRARSDPHFEDRTDVLTLFLRSTYEDGSAMTRREIGDELFLSQNTIKTHTRSIYRKLGVSTRDDAIARGHDQDFF